MVLRSGSVVQFAVLSCPPSAPDRPREPNAHIRCSDAPAAAARTALALQTSLTAEFRERLRFQVGLAQGSAYVGCTGYEPFKAMVWACVRASGRLGSAPDQSGRLPGRWPMGGQPDRPMDVIHPLFLSF